MKVLRISLVIFMVLTLCVVLPESVFAQKNETPSSGSEKIQAKVLNIVEAIKEGKIKVDVEGAGLSSVQVKVKRLTEEGFYVLIPVGTFFVAKGNHQSMISREEVRLDLVKNKEVAYKVPSSCTNIDRDVPGSGDKFDVAISPEAEDLIKLMKVIEKRKPGEVVTQVAIWIVTDNISRGKLDSRYVRRSVSNPSGGGSPAASDDDVVMAMSLVEDAGIDISKKAIYQEKVSALRGLASRNEEVFNLSLRYLGYQGKDKIELLIAALKDNNLGVRMRAAKALGEIKDPRAVEPLIAALKDKDSNVRQSAAEALGKIKDPRAVEALVAALKDEDKYVRENAAEALKKITGENFGEDYAKWQEWWEKNKTKYR